ncbi:MAG: hypothetical protein GY953_47485, partial [bacterium]|nr:hypothetical protein [bacterium]
MQTSRVAIVGSDTLLGREIEDVFSNEAPDIEVVALGSDVSEAILTERGGEPTVVHSIDAQALDPARAVILCGSPTASRQLYERITQLGGVPTVIDLTYALEDLPEACLQAADAGSTAPIHVVAHPAAAVLATFLGQLHAVYPIRRSVVQIFEPASERGKAGV